MLYNSQSTTQFRLNENIKDIRDTNTQLQSTKLTTTQQKDTIQQPNYIKFLKALQQNWLVLGEVLVIFIAKKYPWIGATGGPLKPEFTISRLGVFTIFFINGVALQLNRNRADNDQGLSTQMRINVLIQLFSWVFIPLLGKLLVPFYPVKEFR